MIHQLKIEDEYLANLVSKKKLSEIRFNDRDYQLGDILEFYGGYENGNRYYRFEIIHIHSGLGLKEGYVVLSVKILEEE